MKAKLLADLRALLHANAYSLLLFAVLFGLLYLVGVNVLLAVGVAKVASWAAFAGQLLLAAVRR